MSIVVIGAGPAGLAAARTALRAGAEVTLLDSSDQLGGQFWRHLPDSTLAPKQHVLHHGWSTFEALAREVTQHPACTIVQNAQVWLIEQRDGQQNGQRDGQQGGGAPRVHAHVGPVDTAGRETLTLEPDALILATGAHDRTLPFPGWTLPGVYTAGAAQALAKSERIALGSRAIVAGAGPFLLPVAQSLSLTGSRVLGVYEATTTAALVRGWGAKPWQLTAAVGKVPELAGYVAGQMRRSIPYLTGRAVIEAHGTDRVEAVTIARIDQNWSPIVGTETTIETDAVCVSHGFTPRLELAIAAGCTISADRFVDVDARQQTSIRGVYAAGELTGIAGADAALAEGAVAGHFAAGGPRSATITRAARARDRFVSFGDRLDAVHAPRPGWTRWLRDDTTVCRCEEVTSGELASIQSQTASCGLRSLKLSTRAGLGICQGRICGRSVEELLGGTFADGVHTDRRPIVSPVRIGDLADAAADPPPEDTSYQKKH